MNDPLAEDLNIINRTFLFFNDRKELEKFTSLTFSSANNAAKSGFEKRYLAFKKLSKEAKETYDMDLKHLLEVYQKVSNSLSKQCVRKSSVKKKNIFDIIRGYIIDAGNIPDAALETAIMVLILAGLMPKITSKHGPSENIRKDLEQMYDLFDEFCQNESLQSFNYIDIHRESLMSADDDILCRIFLIAMAKDVLLTLKNYNNRKCLFEVSRKFHNVVVDLDGIYSRYDGDSPSDFWLFFWDDEDGKSYFLIHFYKNKETNRLEFVKYHCIMREYLEMKELTIYSDKRSRILCENSGVEDTNEYAQFWLDFSNKSTNIYPSNDDSIKTISFDRVYSKGLKLPLKTLYRIENNEEYFKLMDTAVCATEAKYLWEPTGTLFAITNDFFYFLLTDVDKASLHIYKKYLKVPRTGDLVMCDNINSDAFLARFYDGAVFLSFYHLNRMFDLRKDNPGFEYVDDIS